MIVTVFIVPVGFTSHTQTPPIMCGREPLRGCVPGRGILFDSQLANDGHESVDELIAEPDPPPGVGKLQDWTAPVCLCDGSGDIACYRAEHGSNHLRLKAS